MYFYYAQLSGIHKKSEKYLCRCQQNNEIVLLQSKQRYEFLSKQLYYSYEQQVVYFAVLREKVGLVHSFAVIYK